MNREPQTERIEITTPPDAHPTVNCVVLHDRLKAGDNRPLHLDLITLQTMAGPFVNGGLSINLRADGEFFCYLHLAPEVVAELSRRLSASSAQLNHRADLQ